MQNKTVKFEEELKRSFTYEPTKCQDNAITALSKFLFDPLEHSLFILKGYAGTGKTTLISTFINILDQWKIKNHLLAPTGRAAKVLGGYAGKKAHTIHRFIYKVFTAPTGTTTIIPRRYGSSDTVFIVDEVSMISAFEKSENPDQPFGNRDILDDLIRFVYSAENCKMIFIGDTAQLPPVGMAESPALEKSFLNAKFNLNLIEYSLEQVVRQEAESGILKNATVIRDKISSNDFSIPFMQRNRTDVITIYGNELLEELYNSFATGDEDHTSVVITRSNKRANLYNKEIRRRILYRENEIEGGDVMMVVQNNYYWLPQESPAGFIANGDLIKIKRVRNFEKRYDLYFADAQISFLDYPEMPDIEVKLLLSTIYSESASLSRADRSALYNGVLKDIQLNHETKSKRVSNNEYYNALQVKFAYSLTCHKTQGGQWPNIFIDHGWIPPDSRNDEYFKWLYTAVTRATKKLFLIGFEELLTDQ